MFALIMVLLCPFSSTFHDESVDSYLEVLRLNGVISMLWVIKFRLVGFYMVNYGCWFESLIGLEGQVE